jgi:hypothetical protein
VNERWSYPSLVTILRLCTLRTKVKDMEDISTKLVLVDSAYVRSEGEEQNRSGINDSFDCCFINAAC